MYVFQNSSPCFFHLSSLLFTRWLTFSCTPCCHFSSSSLPSILSVEEEFLKYFLWEFRVTFVYLSRKGITVYLLNNLSCQCSSLPHASFSARNKFTNWSYFQSSPRLFMNHLIWRLPKRMSFFLKFLSSMTLFLNSYIPDTILGQDSCDTSKSRA